MFEITVKEVQGKPGIDQLALLLSIRSGPYSVWQFDTMNELRQHAYIDGLAYCHGVVDVERHAAELERGEHKTATPRSYEYFQYADLISVDVDKPTTSENTLEWLLAQDWAQYAGLIYPSSSYTAAAPRWHLVFRLSERIYDQNEYTALASAFYRQLTITPDERLTSAIQLSFGTMFRDPTITGKPLDLTYVNEGAVLSVEWLRSLPEYAAPRKVEFELSSAEQIVQAKAYHNSHEGSYRVEQHFKQTPEDREKVVIDALNALLPTFTEEDDRDMWNQVWMSAHHGAPTPAVFATLWKISERMRPNGDEGRRKWVYEWQAHEPRDNGYTVASLFWLAEKRGNWLRYTPFDVPDDVWEIIHVARVSSWTEEQEELPARVVMHSQTGSGKTRNLTYLFWRLNQPKTVVFVPTMKLAADLATTLQAQGVPAELYYDLETGQIKPSEVLKSAHVLVTTLQTFTTRVYDHPMQMADYKLVYVEESDQLISQFSLASSTTLPSHVKREQAEGGFTVLREACEISDYVWFVDATMTQITVDATKALCPLYLQPRLVRNALVKAKAEVEFLDSKEQAYNLALQSLLKGKKVVVACDTKSTAREMYELVDQFGMSRNKRVLLITKETETSKAVVEFMQDANAGAKRYDMVIYNSIMASGVSITSVMPDVLIQIAEYLPPRSNLQILNRYRSQREVFCYYAQINSLYQLTAEEIRHTAKTKVEIERELVGLPLLPRGTTAELRAHLASIATADHYAQNRNARAFYRRLLTDDGRQVVDQSEYPLIDTLDITLEEVREARKAFKDEIRLTWRDVRPVGSDMPASADMSALDIARGMEHYHINKVLHGYVPSEFEPEYIYDVVYSLKPHAPMLSVFANQPAAGYGAEVFLSDPDRPETTFYNNVTHLSVLTLLLDVWGEDLTRVHTLRDLNEIGVGFLTRLDASSKLYDISVGGKNDQYLRVLQENDTVGERVLAFSKILFDNVGLKLKKVGTAETGDGRVSVYGVANLEDAYNFLRWRFHWVNPMFQPDYAGTAAQLERQNQIEATNAFNTMNEADQQLVFARWNGDQTTFYYAVKSVVDDIEWT